MKQEPIAWTDELWTIFKHEDYLKLSDEEREGMIPLYTTPRELSDDEILDLWVKKNNLNGAQDIIGFARAILKKASFTCNGFCGKQECKENQTNCKRLKKASKK